MPVSTFRQEPCNRTPPPWGGNRAIDPPSWGRKNAIVTPAFYPRNSSSYLKRVIVTPAVYPRNSGRYPISTNLTLLLMLLRGNGRVGKNLQSILISVHHIVRFWVSGRSVKNCYAKTPLYFGWLRQNCSSMLQSDTFTLSARSVNVFWFCTRLWCNNTYFVTVTFFYWVEINWVDGRNPSLSNLT